MTNFFKNIPAIRYEGPASTNEFAFRHYNPDEVVLGKRKAIRGRPGAHAPAINLEKTRGEVSIS